MLKMRPDYAITLRNVLVGFVEVNSAKVRCGTCQGLGTALSIAARRSHRTTRRKSPALTALAADWRKLLFPEANDQQFADGYPQAVTFGSCDQRVRAFVANGSWSLSVVTIPVAKAPIVLPRNA